MGQSAAWCRPSRFIKRNWVQSQSILRKEECQVIHRSPRTFACLSVVAACMGAVLPLQLCMAQTARLDANGGSVRSAGIVAEWQAHGNRPAALTVRGEQSAIVLESPFAISIKDRGVLNTAELTPEGEPSVEQLKPEPG